MRVGGRGGVPSLSLKFSDVSTHFLVAPFQSFSFLSFLYYPITSIGQYYHPIHSESQQSHRECTLSEVSKSAPDHCPPTVPAS